MTKIRDLIRANKSSLSFEFFPPKTIEDETKLFDTIGKLKLFQPTFVSVTYGAGGGTAKNTRHIIERILRETSLTPMPHLTCMGQSEAELKEILTDYRDLGVENILALRGDPPKYSAVTGEKQYGCYAKDLIRLVRTVADFSIGVAVYPEGHCESGGLEMDTIYTKQKVDAGADFAITQMYFDNRYYFQFLERAGRAGIYIPVIPGIMPITNVASIKRFGAICGATLPQELIERMEKATDPKEVTKLGIEFATKQVEELLRNGVRYFHFYTMNRADVVGEIIRNVKLDEKLNYPLAASGKK